MMTNREHLAIMAGWHEEQAKTIGAVKRRSPWTAENARQLVAMHERNARILRATIADGLNAVFREV